RCSFSQIASCASPERQLRFVLPNRLIGRTQKRAILRSTTREGAWAVWGTRPSGRGGRESGMRCRFVIWGVSVCAAVGLAASPAALGATPQHIYKDYAD